MAYVDLTSRFVYELQTVFGDFNKLANNDKFVKDNGWEDGTVGVFFQAAAPTGWTKKTTADARALRVVAGSGGGIGGTQDPATTITLAHTHSLPTDADHTHLILDHSHHIAANGTDKSDITHINSVGSVNGVYDLNPSLGAGADNNFKKNTLPLLGSFSTGAAGSHTHGATTSSLTDLSLAYVNVLFCSKDTSSGYTDLTSTFVHNTRHVYDFLRQLAENDAFNYARRTPAGTVSIFGTAASPVGWTKLNTQNAQLLRVTTGTGGGSGGTTDPATLITLAHTHTVSADGSHSHSSPNHVHQLSNNGSTGSNSTSLAFIGSSGGELSEFSIGAGSLVAATADFTNTDGSGTTTSNGSHTHAAGTTLSNITLAYFNVIQASKDSAGAPQVYTDVTALYATYFSDQFLLAYQEMKLMANNDAYLYYHTMPASAVMFFFQSSAPLNWVKSTVDNDKLLRIISDSSGGSSGGSAAFSSAFLLAHTHSLDTQSHTHTNSHSHSMADGTFRHATVVSGRRVYGNSDADLYLAANTGSGGDSPLGTATDSQTLTTDTYSHNHGGNTNSGLSNLTIAYADVIECAKT